MKPIAGNKPRYCDRPTLLQLSNYTIIKDYFTVRWLNIIIVSESVEDLDCLRVIVQLVIPHEYQRSDYDSAGSTECVVTIRKLSGSESYHLD